jgi:signal peptidase I
VVGTISIVAAASAVVLDVKPLVFRSGSMAPAIDAGSLALARDVPATDVRVGDVVSVVGADGVRVTHRVVSTGSTDGATSLTLKGDANPVPDPQAYVVQRADRVVWSVPVAGRVVATLGSPAGTFGIGALVAACLFLAVRPGGGGDRGRRAGARVAGRRRASRARRAVGPRHALVVLGAVALALPAVRPEGTLALFTDTSTLTSGVVQAGSLAAPTAMTCAGGGLLTSPTISWTAPATGVRPTGYRVTVRAGSAAATPTTYTVEGTSWSMPPSLLALGTYFVSVQSARSAAWTSKNYAATGVRMSVLSVAGLLSASCNGTYNPAQPAY